MKINSSDFRIPDGTKVDLDKWPTDVPRFYKSKSHYEKLLATHVRQLSQLQELHYASNRYALLRTFQAMDAVGVS